MKTIFLGALIALVAFWIWVAVIGMTYIFFGSDAAWVLGFSTLVMTFGALFGWLKLNLQ